jgi:hypothetical protein
MFPGNAMRTKPQKPGPAIWMRRLRAAVVVCLLLAGCVQDMADQPKYEPLEAVDAAVSDTLSRPVLEGTIARGELRLDEHFYTGRVADKFVETFPQAVTEEMLFRGQERYDIFCALCHDRTGSGQGTIVRRGFARPPSYHSDRLRTVAAGHLFDVITNGFGRMPDHAAQIPPEDRWAIVAYIRALQLSQNASGDDLTKADLEHLTGSARDDN